jgi:rhodanese-related sulfurtransferase
MKYQKIKTMKTTIAIGRINLLLFFSIFFLNSCTAQINTTLSASEFEKAIGIDSVQLLDVRTDGEYKTGHLTNALLANWNNDTEFAYRTKYLDSTKPVYLYCLAGARSAAAKKYLQQKGFTVFDLQGGLNAWRAAKKNVPTTINATPQMQPTFYTQTINANKTVLVSFSASWCPPCRAMQPILSKLKNNAANKYFILNVNGGNDYQIMQQENVTVLPVFIVYKNGKQIFRKDGVATEKELTEALQF